MKLKNKIYLLQITIAISFILFFFVVYNAYVKQKEKDLQSNIKTIVQTNKLYIEDSLESLYEEHQRYRKHFYKIHQYAQKQYLQNKNIELSLLKERVKKHFNIKDFYIDIFLIDKNYVISHATFKKDIGFDLSIVDDAKMYLDKTTKDSKIYVASNISIDAMDYALKVFSYSKATKNEYFELAFKLKNPIYSKLKRNVENIYNTTKNKISLFRIITTADKKYQYYNDLLYKPKEDISKQEYFKTIERFEINTHTPNKIISSLRQNRLLAEIIDNRYIVYVPILNKNTNKYLFYNDLILKIEIDIASYQQTLSDTKQKFYIFGFIVLLFLMLLYYFIRYNFYKPMSKITDTLECEKKIEDEELLNKTDEFGILVEKYNKLYDSLSDEIKLNSNLLTENKRFIADTVHQIRTPLTNIMMNGEMVKKFQKDDKLSLFIDQIDASINMLSNSYEDLAYITSYETIEYKPNRVSLTDMINKRIKFFSTISKVNFKEIISNIEDNIYIYINEIELERIIDNNISNGIKYGQENKNITIKLTKDEDSVVLTFKTYGKPIKNKEKVFEKNYRENEGKRGLGLGLNMVKGICEKYDITYTVLYEDEQNIFKYIFKA